MTLNTATDIPSTEPLKITKGSTVKWSKTLSHYPADDGWVLTYAFRGGVVLDVAAIADGSDHSVTLSATATGALAAGAYWWQSYATKGSERFDVEAGSLQVIADLASLQGGVYDGRTHEKKVLDSLQATLEGRASTLDREVKINGREVKFYEMTDILVFYDKYKALVAQQDNQERVNRGEKSSSNVYMRFGRA